MSSPVRTERSLFRRRLPWLCALVLVPVLFGLGGELSNILGCALVLGLLTTAAYALGAALVPRQEGFRICGGVLMVVLLIWCMVALLFAVPQPRKSDIDYWNAVSRQLEENARKSHAD